MRSFGLKRLVALGLVLAATGCGRDASLLANTHRTPDAVIEAALEALEAEDSDMLDDLLVSREEFESYLWPSMPDRENTRLDFFWGTMEANTRKGLRQLENNYGGIAMEVVSIEMPPFDDREAYEDFAFHVGARVTVRRLDTGEVGVLPSFDGLVEYRGRWKLLNYDEL